MKTRSITSRDFTDDVLRSPEPVLVSFGASWCVPSQQLGSAIDDVASSFKGRVKVVAVDIDDPDSAAICRRYKVTRVPVTMMFSDGQVTDVIGGFTSKDSVAEMVDKRLAPVLEVGEHNFDVEVLASKLPTLVHFDAAWCKQSKQLVPMIDEIAERYRGRAKVVRVEFGPETARLCARYGVVRVPTTAVFVDGEMQDEILGAMVGGTKRGARRTSCVGLTSQDNLTSLVSQFVL